MKKKYVPKPCAILFFGSFSAIIHFVKIRYFYQKGLTHMELLDKLARAEQHKSALFYKIEAFPPFCGMGALFVLILR